MERPQAFSEVYRDSIPVQKIKAGARTVFALDKDGTIQANPQPVKAPSDSELSAGKEIRRRLAEYPLGFSSAQTLELTISTDKYLHSVGYGFDRPRPNILLPDGSYVYNPALVKGWEYLIDPDFFLGFGSGMYTLKNGGYIRDPGLQDALDDHAWRDRIFADLDHTFPDGSYKENLGTVDRKGLYEKGEVDVAPLAYRIQFDHKGPGAVEARENFCLHIMKEKLLGRFKNIELVDESNPKKQRCTTYLVDAFWQKEVMLERYGNQLSFHSEVPMKDLRFIKVGDSPTDLASGLIAFQGAADTELIIAGDRLADAISNNRPTFAGRLLVGGPKHPTIPGWYHPTETPGVFMWKGPWEKPRKVTLAALAPWSRGLPCTESVLACIDELGFK